MADPSHTLRAITDPVLPPERALVARLRTGADRADGRVRGRVAHVVSGAAARFDSLEELICHMRAVVAQRAR